ncbi:MAG: type II secretion system protein GspL [bacterium]
MRKTVGGASGGFSPRRVVSVASEAVTILRVTLPPLPAAQRRAAALYAAEPFIAQPLEEVQVILGPKVQGEGGEAGYLLAVVAKDRLARILAANRVSGARLVPDVLLLPRPVAGQWTIATRAGTVMARLPDGTGFAAQHSAFAAIWEQAGKPDLVLVHGLAPEGIAVARMAVGPMPASPETELAGFDLAEGQTQDWRRPGRIAAVAAVLALGVVGHLGVMAVQAHRASVAADGAEATLRALLAERGVKIGTSLEAAATTALRGGSDPSAGGFLPLLGQAMAAMAPQAGVVTVTDMTYDAKAGRLSLTLLAPDLARLQDIEGVLAGAGLQGDIGASTMSAGQAKATVAITGGAG